MTVDADNHFTAGTIYTDERRFKKEKMNKKYLMFGLPLLALALVSAGFLAYYGVITQEVVIGQAVVLTGGGLISDSFVAGDSLTTCGSVKNHAGVEAPIQFETTCNNSVGYDDGTQYESYIDWISVVGNDRCNGIITEIYGELNLTTKNVVFGSSPWAENGNAKAIVKYNIVGNDINAEVTESNGITLSEYTLIYYKDNSDRWNSPAQAIKLDGITGSLPYGTDGNLGEYNYCDGNATTEEDYEHCHGAKIWLVPNSALTSCVGSVCDISWGQASNFLFETDLIVYSDDTSNEITLPSNGGGFNFCVENDFALNLVADTYTIDTKILSVV